jgi:hypothetical protein
LRHKKLIIGTGICLLGIALSAAWFVPCKLEATYAGKTPYQYDVISAKSFHASTVSLLGRKNPVTDVSISPKELSKSPQNITVTYGDMSVSMDGGGSSSLVVNGKLLNTPAQYDERPVVDFLSFLP